MKKSLIVNQSHVKLQYISIYKQNMELVYKILLETFNRFYIKSVVFYSSHLFKLIIVNQLSRLGSFDVLVTVFYYCYQIHCSICLSHLLKRKSFQIMKRKDLFYQTIKKALRRNSHVPEPITQGTSLVTEISSYVLQPCIFTLSGIIYLYQIQQHRLTVLLACAPLFY